MARAGYLGVLLKEQVALSGIRDSSVLNQEIEAAKFLADALRRFGNRDSVRHVELERDGSRPDLAGRSLAAFEITRPDKYCGAVRHEFLRDLKSDSLVGACDQGDAFVWHVVLLYVGCLAATAMWSSSAMVSGGSSSV